MAFYRISFVIFVYTTQFVFIIIANHEWTLTKLDFVRTFSLFESKILLQTNFPLVFIITKGIKVIDKK